MPHPAAQQLFQFGVAQLNQQQYAAARAAFDQALALDRQYVEPLLYRAVIFILHLDDLEQGIADCQAALRLAPGHPMAHGNRGIAYLKQNAFAQAIPDLEIALRATPLDGNMHRMKAYCHYELEQYAEAIEHYTACLRFWHEQALSHDMRGICHFYRHEFDAALDDFNAALRLKPDHPGTLTNRGVLYTILGQYERALADHDRALRRQRAPGYYCNRGLTHLIQGSHAQAQADCDRAFERDARFADAFGLRGLLRLQAGDAAGALADFEQMSTGQPRSERQMLAACSATRYAQGDTAAALALWRMVVSRYPLYADSAWVSIEFRLSPPLLPHVLALVAALADATGSE